MNQFAKDRNTITSVIDSLSLTKKEPGEIAKMEKLGRTHVQQKQIMLSESSRPVDYIVNSKQLRYLSYSKVLVNELGNAIYDNLQELRISR